MITVPDIETLQEQLTALPRLVVELLEACTDPSSRAAEVNTGGRRTGTDPLAAPIELNLTILDFLAEPSDQGRLGLHSALAGIEAVTRAALGAAELDGFDRLSSGLEALRALGLEDRVTALGSMRLVEMGTLAGTLRWLGAQAGRICDAQAWTAAAAAAVKAMYDEATVGIDVYLSERLEEQWRTGRTAARELVDAANDILDQMDRAEGEQRELLAVALPPYEQRVAALAAVHESLPEFMGRYLDSISGWYACAAAGPEQWADFVAEELHRLHSRAEQLLGQAITRTLPITQSQCPYCETHGLVLTTRPPSATCRRRTELALERGEEPPVDRCCGEFMECMTCGKSLSMRRDVETGESEASLTFTAWRRAGFIPVQQARRVEPAPAAHITGLRATA